MTVESSPLHKAADPSHDRPGLDSRGLSIAEVRAINPARVAGRNAIIRIRSEEENAPALVHAFNDRRLRNRAKIHEHQLGFYRRRTDEKAAQSRNERDRPQPATSVRDTRQRDNLST